jgi:acyl-coenzyme A synthetase/AMP-(fatty) acid ligase
VYCRHYGLDNRTLYIVYGPLLNGATTVILKVFLLIQILVVFWQIIDKPQNNTVYTAPTAIWDLAKENLEYVSKIWQIIKKKLVDLLENQ